MADATPSDLDLLSRARRGESSAVAELYSRHAGAARRLAATYPRAGDPDDLVNESFERVLGAIGRGSGPDEAFRAYLFVTLRRVAAEQAARAQAEPIPEVPPPVEARANRGGPDIDPADRQIVLSAYQSLPDRQQAVLWHTAVEGRPPRDLAPVLGVSANAVAAMASRARERLREAYLQAHLQVPPPPGCEPYRSRLGAYVRDGLSARDKTATDDHVAACVSCKGLVIELADVNQLLVRAVHPWFLAGTTTGVVAAVASSAAGGGAVGGATVGRLLGAGRRVASRARSNPFTVGVIVAAAALAAALAGLRIGDDRPQDAAPAEAPAPADDPPADDPPARAAVRAPAPDPPDPPAATPASVTPPAPTTTTPAPPPTSAPPATAAPTTAPPTAAPPARLLPPTSLPPVLAPPPTPAPPDPVDRPPVSVSGGIDVTLPDDDPPDGPMVGVSARMSLCVSLLGPDCELAVDATAGVALGAPRP